MTNLRQAAQQALEALERYGGVDQRACDAEEALRAALAEPEQEPVALPCCGYANASAVKWNPHNQVVQCHNCGQIYTAPTPRKPLTEEEIVRLMVGEDRVQLLYAKPDDPYFSEFAQGAIRELVESGRAIEKAHGIGEQHE